MSNLVSVRGPHARNTNNVIRIQWNMGNSCNYSCEYCPPMLHNGTKPWLNKEQYINAISRLSTHYNALDKQTEYELIGGEVTVIPGFKDIVKCINEHNSTSIVYTNASRTVNWWSKAKHYMDSVVLTYHPLTQDKQHFLNVINEIKDYIHIDVNIAGIGGDVLRLGEFAEEIRELFKDCTYNRYNDISICVKTMYRKLLGRQNKQETYWQYTKEEQEVMQRPGIKAQVLPEKEQLNIPGAEYVPDPEPDPNAWMTEFLYDNGHADYVQSHQIIDKGLNTFQGMRCHLGFESLNIDASGDMYSSWCGAVNFGNVSDKIWNLPETKTVCPYTFCNNISDISITKTLN